MAMRTSAPASVDEYIAASPAAVRPILREIRRTISTAAPGAEELISYRMPAFRLRGILVYFAAFKHHIGLYPRCPAMRGSRRPSRRMRGQGAISSSRWISPVPYALIKRITRLRVGQNISQAPARETKGRGGGRTARAGRR